MDEGPFRVSRRSAEENTDNEPEFTSKPVEQPKHHPVESKPVHRSSTHPPLNEKKFNKKIIAIIAAVIAVIVCVVVVFSLVSNGLKPGTAIDGSKYQAVFFTNGQVYFGKLQQFNDEYMKLKDVYYLQTQSTEQETDSKNPQETANDQGNTTLIKLGDEVHGPEDEMIISKQQVLFYENLKTDGKVSQSIEKFKNPN